MRIDVEKAKVEDVGNCIDCPALTQNTVVWVLIVGGRFQFRYCPKHFNEFTRRMMIQFARVMFEEARTEDIAEDAAREAINE